MMRSRSGKIDVATVASMAAVVAALAAVVLAGLVAWELREQGRRAQVSAGLESLWHLSDEWNSPTMLDVRSAAAAGLLAGTPTLDADAVLDFFAEVALLVRRGAVDEELAAMHFYWPMANYWLAMQHALESGAGGEPSGWSDLSDMVTHLSTVEAQRRGRAAADLLPSPEQVRSFLSDEQRDNECTDDSEAQRTPA